MVPGIWVEEKKWYSICNLDSKKITNNHQLANIKNMLPNFFGYLLLNVPALKYIYILN